MGNKEYGYSSKQRNSGLKHSKKIMLIATEGNNQTETNYFRHFKSSNYRIIFTQGNDTDPVKMMTTLKKQFKEIGLEQDKGDLGVCLVDTDCEEFKNSQIKAADMLSTKSIKQYVSSPCFEIWLLCHFEFSTKQYNSSNEVIKSLKKYLADYVKNDETIFEKTMHKIEIAIKNAKALNKYCVSTGKSPHTVEFMPSSEIVNIVEILIN